jgi:hypothetical protein
VSFLRFQIRYPNGQVEQLQVEAERVLIGSGAHCEIRLPVDQASMEAVRVQRGAAGVYAEALSFDPPPTINNTPFSQAPLQAESILGVGQVQIYVSLSEEGRGATTVAKKEQKSNPVLLFLCMVGTIAGSYFFIFDQGEPGPAAQPKEVPDLWDAPVTACARTSSAEQAIAVARDKESIADARRERRPFHAQDGVAAVPLYETAAACFRQGGDAASAAESANEAATLRKEMYDDYKTHRVRLEHALSIQDLVTSRKEVRTLLAFLEGRQGDYVTWLSNLDRKLKLKVGRQS